MPISEAFCDESFQESAGADGIYVLAASIVDQADHGRVREAMTALRGKRRSTKLHWSEMDEGQRQDASRVIAELPALHLAVVGSPVPPKRQERARASCLEGLICWLHGCGVEAIHLESRTPTLDQRDLRRAIGIRFAIGGEASFVIDHLAGSSEPLLWMPDIVAGAVFAEMRGAATCRKLLGSRLRTSYVTTKC